jgi:flagellar operon protein
MALEKMNINSGIAPLGQSGVEGLGKSNGASKISEAEFKRAMEQFAPAGGTASLQGISQGASGLEKLKFSNHAIERMRSRGITFQPEEMKSIEGAVSKAAAKGSKDTLVLSGDNALIVSVKNNTVVTVMDKQAMKDNVFTNIDSTVVV